MCVGEAALACLLEYMNCLNCNESKTIKAHLIPKAFVQEVKSSPGEKMMMVHETAKANVSNTGVYDSEILCGPCDTHLGAHEGYVHKLLKDLRFGDPASNAVVQMDSIHGDVIIRFAAGIAWKFANTRKEWGRIDVGPYVDLLRDVALREAPIPASLDVAMIRLVELDGDVYFFRAPKPDRNDHINMVRFTVGSFLFFLKIDRRSNSNTLPAKCWLRGRSNGAFIVAPAHKFEEGRLHKQLATSPPVRGFFGEMRARQSRR